MAALPPENTQRFWVAYYDGWYNHELMLRGRTDTTNGDFITIVQDFMAAISTAFYAITLTGYRHADAGDTFSNPVTLAGTITFGSGVMPGANAPRELAWEGRSNDSRLVSYSMYGYAGATPNVYRFQAEDIGALSDARDVLDGAHDDGLLCTISGLKAEMKGYINFNFNSYYEEKRRG